MWDRANQIIHGSYLGSIPYQGVVSSSRVMLTGDVRHYVDLLEPIDVLGTERDSIVIKESDIFYVDGEVFPCYDQA